MSAFRIKVLGQKPYYGIFANGSDAWTAAQNHFPLSTPIAVIDLTRVQQRQMVQ